MDKLENKGIIKNKYREIKKQIIKKFMMKITDYITQKLEIIIIQT